MLLRRPTGAITVVCVTVRVDPEKPLSWPLASGLTFGDLCLAPLPLSAPGEGHVRFRGQSGHGSRQLLAQTVAKPITEQVPLLRICRKCKERCYAPIQFIQVIRTAGW